MKIASFAGIVALAVAACGMTVPAASAPVEIDRPFTLKPGEAAATSDGRWRVGFDAVIADSRCPKGEQCIRAGDATVRIWVQPEAAARVTHEMTLTLAAPPAVRAGAHELRLLRLDPYPVSGRTVAPGDYVATLQLGRPGAAGGVER